MDIFTARRTEQFQCAGPLVISGKPELLDHTILVIFGAQFVHYMEIGMFLVGQARSRPKLAWPQRSPNFGASLPIPHTV